MAVENLILLGIVLFLVFILYKTLGNQQKNKVQMPKKISFFSEKTGQIIEMNLIENIHDIEQSEKLSDEAFLLRAKLAFQTISESFCGGNLSELKANLEQSVYTVFAEQIKKRQESKQTIDFSIVCFNSAEITHKSPAKDEITVQFVTEQINVLKNEKGEAIEGDPMSIATVKDIWTFKKLRKNKWLVSATQSEAA